MGYSRNSRVAYPLVNNVGARLDRRTVHVPNLVGRNLVGLT